MECSLAHVRLAARGSVAAMRCSSLVSRSCLLALLAFIALGCGSGPTANDAGLDAGDGLVPCEELCAANDAAGCSTGTCAGACAAVHENAAMGAACVAEQAAVERCALTQYRAGVCDLTACEAESAALSTCCAETIGRVVCLAVP